MVCTSFSVSHIYHVLYRVDVDECAAGTSYCTQGCINEYCSDGRYQCFCNDGYVLYSDNYTCIGKDGIENGLIVHACFRSAIFNGYYNPNTGIFQYMCVIYLTSSHTYMDNIIMSQGCNKVVTPLLQPCKHCKHVVLYLL